MEISNVRDFSSLTGMSSRKLAKMIFAADVPEHYIRSLPAQSLYLTIKYNGLASSAELLQHATREQCRLCLDFDLWQKDHFSEENFWDWLAVTDATDGLELLQKLYNCFDLKLIGMLIGRYVQVEWHEEPTDQPPGPGSYTPDKGRTWLTIDLEEESKYFLLARLLALIFESNADLYYQILSIPTVATATMLEEESFIEKTKRLAAEGIPDDDFAFSVNQPLKTPAALAELQQKKEPTTIVDLPTVTPLFCDSAAVQPLESVLSAVAARRDIGAELSLLMNAAIVFWLHEFHDRDQVLELSAKVKGALNIGLQVLTKESGLSGEEIFATLGAVKLYRVGLGLLKQLQADLRSRRAELTPRLETDNKLAALVSGLEEGFPAMPSFINSDGSLIEMPPGHLPGGYRPIELWEEIDVLRCHCGL